MLDNNFDMEYNYFKMKYMGGDVVVMTLKQIRKKRGLSQSELGSLVGLKQTTIAQYENGSRKPNIVIAKKLANVLDMTLDDFFCSIIQ